jgi:hypothetical protein
LGSIFADRQRDIKTTGMNPKAGFGNQFRSKQLGVNIAPLSFARGIIQLTDITVLRL